MNPWSWGYCDFVRDCRAFRAWHRAGRRGVPVALRGWADSRWTPAENYSLRQIVAPWRPLPPAAAAAALAA
jgi:hypothetical protein